MSYRKYIATISVPGEQLLAEWRWLVAPRLGLWLVTKGGDAILTDSTDGSIHFLNTMSAGVQRLAASETEFEIAVADEDNSREWLLTPLVDEMELRGAVLGLNQCYHLKSPPVLGGKVAAENMVVIDVTDRFGAMGQLMRQIQDVPDGAQLVTRRTQSIAKPKRQWWKFW